MGTTDFLSAATSLASQSLLKLHDARGRKLLVIDGMVWVTQDGDPRDVFIGAGESFEFDRAGLTLVQALEPTHLLMLARD